MEKKVLRKLLGKHSISYNLGLLIKSLVIVRICDTVGILSLELSKFTLTFLNYQDPLYEYIGVFACYSSLCGVVSDLSTLPLQVQLSNFSGSVYS